MVPWARECSVADCKLLAIDSPFSNFRFIDQNFPDVWPLRRTLSQVRARRGRSMVIERLDSTQARDLSEENEDIEKLFSKQLQSDIWRLSFFTKPLPNKQALEQMKDEDFLGYAIVKNDSVAGGPDVSRIYESVMAPSRHENNFIHGATNWTVTVAGCQFHISGYLYAQQNGWTNCCAHVACRTAAVRFHQNGDMPYREMNRLVGIDHTSRTAEKGLDGGEMVRILESAGARCEVADYQNLQPSFKPPMYQKYLYGSIESGYPAILCFRTLIGSDPPYHAIPVFGHTFNEDMWVPSASWCYFEVGAGIRYVPSEQWLCSFLGHDDNVGSNYCIPRYFLRTRPRCDTWPAGPILCQVEPDCVAHVIATLPKNVTISAVTAEVIGAEYLFRIRQEQLVESNDWWTRLETYAVQNKLVLRPVLVTASEYANHLRHIEDTEAKAIQNEIIEWVAQFSDNPLWMVELSVPELFSENRRKLGEVLLWADRATSTNRDFSNFMVARVPGYFVFFTGLNFSKAEFSFLPSPVKGHVALFEHKIATL